MQVVISAEFVLVNLGSTYSLFLKKTEDMMQDG
jgi:hypothetical protein